MGNMLSFTLEKEGRRIRAVYFGDADAFLEQFEKKFSKEDAKDLLCGKGTRKLSYLYQPQVHTFRGEESIEVIIKRIKWE